MNIEMNFLRQPLNCYFQNCMCIRPARSSDKIFKITRYANASAHLSLLLKLPSDKRILSDRCLQSFPLLSAENSYLIGIATCKFCITFHLPLSHCQFFHVHNLLMLSHAFSDTGKKWQAASSWGKNYWSLCWIAV